MNRKLYLTILGTVILGSAIFSLSYAEGSKSETSENNEKFIECWDYKEKIVSGNPNALLLNCVEYANSEYDTIKEYINEEHSELKGIIPSSKIKGLEEISN